MLGERKKSILIVEDEISVAETLNESLNFLGYKVAGVTSSGKEAIRLSEVKKPDLILMDISLESGIDGIDSAKEIGLNTDVPIIYISGITDAVTLGRVISSESYGYIVKPYDINELKVAIELALSKYRKESNLNKLMSHLRNKITVFERELLGWNKFKKLKNSWFY